MKGKIKENDDFMQKKRILCKKMNKNSGILHIRQEYHLFFNFYANFSRILYIPQENLIFQKKMNKTTGKLNIPKESVIFFRNISIARKKSSFQGVFCR
ncbi:hypothetical protein [uncultured Treponema sp.]|uniref:hypothetical protein n=1 Tax=uncultured Treponema sp. TaxID=162155 RepID=UPI0025FCE487|nr:hypothetical protein [uncultured Treponema sp.]